MMILIPLIEPCISGSHTWKPVSENTSNHTHTHSYLENLIWLFFVALAWVPSDEARSLPSSWEPAIFPENFFFHFELLLYTYCINLYKYWTVPSYLVATISQPLISFMIKGFSRVWQCVYVIDDDVTEFSTVFSSTTFLMRPKKKNPRLIDTLWHNGEGQNKTKKKTYFVLSLCQW